MILARIAAVFAGKNAKAKDFMIWPTEEKTEVTPQNLMRVLQTAATQNKRNRNGKQEPGVADGRPDR